MNRIESVMHSPLVPIASCLVPSPILLHFHNLFGLHKYFAHPRKPHTLVYLSDKFLDFHCLIRYIAGE